jgi:hypothetical protein
MSDLKSIIKKVLRENRKQSNYMFFSNLEQMKRHIDDLMNMDPSMIDDWLSNGHDWADDHISKAKENLDHVYEFFMNEIPVEDAEFEMVETEKKDTTLCSRGIAAAKAKYDVYPSAYANGYAVQVCKGDMPDVNGVKRCSGKYCPGK